MPEDPDARRRRLERKKQKKRKRKVERREGRRSRSEDTSVSEPVVDSDIVQQQFDALSRAFGREQSLAVVGAEEVRRLIRERLQAGEAPPTREEISELARKTMERLSAESALSSEARSDQDEDASRKEWVDKPSVALGDDVEEVDFDGHVDTLRGDLEPDVVDALVERSQRGLEAEQQRKLLREFRRLFREYRGYQTDGNEGASFDGSAYWKAFLGDPAGVVAELRRDVQAIRGEVDDSEVGVDGGVGVIEVKESDDSEDDGVTGSADPDTSTASGPSERDEPQAPEVEASEPDDEADGLAERVLRGLGGAAIAHGVAKVVEQGLRKVTGLGESGSDVEDAEFEDVSTADTGGDAVDSDALEADEIYERVEDARAASNVERVEDARRRLVEGQARLNSEIAAMGTRAEELLRSLQDVRSDLERIRLSGNPRLAEIMATVIPFIDKTDLEELVKRANELSSAVELDETRDRVVAQTKLLRDFVAIRGYLDSIGTSITETVSVVARGAFGDVATRAGLAAQAKLTEFPSLYDSMTERLSAALRLREGQLDFLEEMSEAVAKLEGRTFADVFGDDEAPDASDFSTKDIVDIPETDFEVVSSRFVGGERFEEEGGPAEEAGEDVEDEEADDVPEAVEEEEPAPDVEDADGEVESDGEEGESVVDGSSSVEAGAGGALADALRAATENMDLPPDAAFMTDLGLLGDLSRKVLPDQEDLSAKLAMERSRLLELFKTDPDGARAELADLIETAKKEDAMMFEDEMEGYDLVANKLYSDSEAPAKIDQVKAKLRAQFADDPDGARARLARILDGADRVLRGRMGHSMAAKSLSEAEEALRIRLEEEELEQRGVRFAEDLGRYQDMLETLFGDDEDLRRESFNVTRELLELFNDDPIEAQRQLSYLLSIGRRERADRAKLAREAREAGGDAPGKRLLDAKLWADHRIDFGNDLDELIRLSNMVLESGDVTDAVIEQDIAHLRGMYEKDRVLARTLLDGRLEVAHNERRMMLDDRLADFNALAEELFGNSAEARGDRRTFVDGITSKYEANPDEAESDLEEGISRLEGMKERRERFKFELEKYKKALPIVFPGIQPDDIEALMRDAGGRYDIGNPEPAEKFLADFFEKHEAALADVDLDALVEADRAPATSDVDAEEDDSSIAPLVAGAGALAAGAAAASMLGDDDDETPTLRVVSGKEEAPEEKKEEKKKDSFVERWSRRASKAGAAGVVLGAGPFKLASMGIRKLWNWGQESTGQKEVNITEDEGGKKKKKAA